MAQREFTFEAIGTKWDVRIAGELTAERWAALKQAVLDRTDAFDKTYSRFRKDSWVAQLARAPATYELPNDGYKLLQIYDKLYKATNGIVTPLIGQVLEQAGYDAEYSLTPKKLTQPPKWEDVIEYSEESITMKQPALLDFGAAGKGYLVDIVGELISSFGLQSYSINASGDILHYSQTPEKLTIGLEHPNDPSQIIGTVELANKSLCASATSRRKWGKYHHIMNPLTLKPATEVLATWVIADDTMTADALATALFFVPPKRLSRDFKFSYAVLSKDMSFAYDHGFPVHLFTDNK